MKTDQKYLEDISEIRKVMDRSTRFLTLNGLTGILAGVYALIGAYVAYQLFYYNTDEVIYNTLSEGAVSENIMKLIGLALIVLVLTLGTALVLAYRHAAKQKESYWNSAAKRLVINLFIPLLTGGAFIIILLSKGALGFVAPSCLLFYGLALVNASKYTYDEARYLGVAEILLGLIGAALPGYGLFLWALGFGVLHIIYGIYMHLRYEK